MLGDEGNVKAACKTSLIGQFSIEFILFPLQYVHKFNVIKDEEFTTATFLLSVNSISLLLPEGKPLFNTNLVFLASKTPCVLAQILQE